MRIIGACILSLLAMAAAAENRVIDRATIRYQYTTNKLGSLHFCDLATYIIREPAAIKLTAAFVTDDRKPEDHVLTVAYIAELFDVSLKDGALKMTPAKVVAARIVSETFNSDLHATKNDTGASYIIPSERSRSLFTALMLTGEYSLYVEVQGGDSVTVKVRSTPDLGSAYEKWTKCGIALMEHRAPQE